MFRHARRSDEMVAGGFRLTATEDWVATPVGRIRPMPPDLRQRIPRDVFGKCNVGERIRKESKVPGSAWRAMAALRPELIERAKAGEYRTCVRTFATESEDVVAIFLFYNKAKIS